jgi:hypothetical protein
MQPRLQRGLDGFPFGIDRPDMGIVWTTWILSMETFLIDR